MRTETSEPRGEDTSQEVSWSGDAPGATAKFLPVCKAVLWSCLTAFVTTVDRE